MAKQLRAWGPAVFWMAAIFVASHQSVVVIPFGSPDYLAHGASYAVLAGLFVWALAGGDLSGMRAPLILPAVVLATLYGLSDEFHQSFVPGRLASVSDVVADSVGALVGAVAATALGTRRRV